MVIFITGPRHSGKTECVKNIIRILKEQKTGLAGVLSPSEYTGGEKNLYFVQSAASGKKKYLLSTSSGEPRISPAGFKFARDILSRASNRAIVIIDEFGPLEMAGAGYFAQTAALCKRPFGSVIITVRTSLARKAPGVLNIREYKLLDVGKCGPEKTAELCLKALK